MPNHKQPFFKFLFVCLSKILVSLQLYKLLKSYNTKRITKTICYHRTCSRANTSKLCIKI